VTEQELLCRLASAWRELRRRSKENEPNGDVIDRICRLLDILEAMDILATPDDKETIL